VHAPTARFDAIATRDHADADIMSMRGEGLGMGKVPNSIPWWQSIGFSKPDTAQETDYADMGTAFGLDASMAPPDWDDAPGVGDAPSGSDRLNGRSIR
jgi:hypothetical protein